MEVTALPLSLFCVHPFSFTRLLPQGTKFIKQPGKCAPISRRLRVEQLLEFVVSEGGVHTMSGSIVRLSWFSGVTGAAS